METVEVTETVAVLKGLLIVQFKKVGNDVQVYKLWKCEDVPKDAEPINPNFGAPSGSFTVGQVVKYVKNPPCIGFMMGGTYYEICF